MSRDNHSFIIWNGEPSTNKNLVMLTAPDMPTAVRRGNADNSIAYLPGDYWTDFNSFDVIKKKAKFLLKRVNWDKYYDIRGWLQGSGRLSFSDCPSVEYDARISNIEVVEQPGTKIITVNFVIQPLGYLVPAEPAKSMDMDAEELVMPMQNLGNIESYPIIKITGDGSCVINIKRGDEILQTLGIDYLDEETVIMDSDPYVQEAYSEDGTESKNWLMVGAFLRLPNGVFEIELVPRNEYSVFTEFTVEPRWRFV